MALRHANKNMAFVPKENQGEAGLTCISNELQIDQGGAYHDRSNVNAPCARERQDKE